MYLNLYSSSNCAIVCPCIVNTSPNELYLFTVPLMLLLAGVFLTTSCTNVMLSVTDPSEARGEDSDASDSGLPSIIRRGKRKSIVIAWVSSQSKNDDEDEEEAHLEGIGPESENEDMNRADSTDSDVIMMDEAGTR